MQKICRTCRKVFGSSEQLCPDHQGYLVLHSLVGDVLLGRYRVTEMVGAGLDALVCRGVDEQLGYPVAIKALLLDPDGYRFVVNRFLREAETYAALSDPRFPRVFARNMLQDGRPYFVFEWVDGESLHELLAKEGRLVAPLAVRLAMEVAAALHHAHERGFVHLDVTPGNILRYQDATRVDHVKIIDFGIVRVSVGSEVAEQGLRRPLGNPPYMSPEQWRRQSLDARADVWALGATLYELLSGRPPFGSGDWEAVRHRALHEDPPGLRQRIRDELPVHIPDALDELVMRMLDKEPDRRPRTMLEVHTALRSLVEQLEADALPYARFLTLFDERPLLGLAAAANDGDTIPRPSVRDTEADLPAMGAGPDVLEGGPDTWTDSEIHVQLSPEEVDPDEPVAAAVLIPERAAPAPGGEGDLLLDGVPLDRLAVLELRPLGASIHATDSAPVGTEDPTSPDVARTEPTPPVVWHDFGDDLRQRRARDEASVEEDGEDDEDDEDGFGEPQQQPQPVATDPGADALWRLAAGPLSAWPVAGEAPADGSAEPEDEPEEAELVAEAAPGEEPVQAPPDDDVETAEELEAPIAASAPAGQWADAGRAADPWRDEHVPQQVLVMVDSGASPAVVDPEAHTDPGVDSEPHGFHDRDTSPERRPAHDDDRLQAIPLPADDWSQLGPPLAEGPAPVPRLDRRLYVAAAAAVLLVALSAWLVLSGRPEAFRSLPAVATGGVAQGVRSVDLLEAPAPGRAPAAPPRAARAAQEPAAPDPAAVAVVAQAPQGRAPGGPDAIPRRTTASVERPRAVLAPIALVRSPAAALVRSRSGAGASVAPPASRPATTKGARLASATRAPAPAQPAQANGSPLRDVAPPARTAEGESRFFPTF